MKNKNEDEDTLSVGIETKSTEEVNSNYVQKKNKEHLELLLNQVQGYNWEFQRVETKSYYHNLEDFGTENCINLLKWVYKCKMDYDTNNLSRSNNVTGEIHISYEYNDELRFECMFRDSGLYHIPQSIIVSSIEYDEKLKRVNEFFETYMIPIQQRIENEIPTPKIDEIYDKLNYQIYHYEHNNILLNTLFKSDSDRRILKRTYEWFNDKVKDLYLKNGVSLTKYENWFGDETRMIISFLEENINGGYLDLFLEDQIDEIKDIEWYWEDLEDKTEV